jgi:DUF1009 family protein
MTGTIGLIAGNGTFPIFFARAAKKRGLKVVAVGMRGETLPAVEGEVDEMTWTRVGQVGAMIRAFVRAGIREAAMAGGVRKTRLFERARPDFVAMKLLARAVVRRDDGMLRLLAAEFEKNGITIIDSTIFMPEALAPNGVLTRTKPSDREWQDLRYGLHVAREIGRLDIGQTVVVKDGAVVALEAIEGTDACIARAGELTGNKGAVIVKVAKPSQDMRFDVPAIGPRTIASMSSAGVRVLGIEAGRTLVLEPDTFLREADAQSIIVVGLTDADLAKAVVQ